MESLEFRSLLCTLAVAHDGMQIEQSEVVDLGAISPGERKEMEFVFSVDGCDNGVDIDIKSWPNEYRIKNPISRRLDADTPTQTLTIVAHAYGDKTYQGVSTGSFRVTARRKKRSWILSSGRLSCEHIRSRCPAMLIRMIWLTSPIS